MRSVDLVISFLNQEKTELEEFKRTHPDSGFYDLKQWVDSMPKPQSIEDSLKRAELEFWVHLKNQWAVHLKGLGEVQTQLEATENRILQLRDDRKTRSIKKERFFVYLQDERKQLLNISYNLNVHKKALNQAKNHLITKRHQRKLLENEILSSP